MQYLNFYLLPLLTARDFIDLTKLFKFNSLSSFKSDLLISSIFDSKGLCLKWFKLLPQCSNDRKSQLELPRKFINRLVSNSAVGFFMFRNSSNIL